MQLISGHNLSVSFAARELFSGANFGLQQNARVGLTGANGCGKTTLLKLIIGEMQPQSGQIVRSREARPAYMEQTLAADDEQTLHEAALAVFAPLMQLEAELERVNQRLSAGGDAALLAEQHRLQEEYAAAGGYTFRARTISTLQGLGFEPPELALPVRALSGGQRSKAALARVLLQDANILLLDEPTNHLDIAAIEWLEQFLGAFRGAFIVISHDRYFLDKITNETWHMQHGRLDCRRGNYSAARQAAQGDDEALLSRYQNQLSEIKRLEGVIEQQRRWNQARNFITIQSKEKQIARLKQDLVAPEKQARELDFSFSSPPPGGNDVLRIFELAKGYGEKRLFANAELRVNKGERVFLAGPNGCGKTTLMKIIIGEIAADSGTVKLGVNIRPLYYDQIQGHIHGRGSILAHFTDAYPRLTQTRLRTMLGSFLFPGEDVEKCVENLSGGEKARLSLLKLVLEPANFLLLDEPTNHLDIASREAVEQALLAYPGAMLIVSHDRYLINKLADRVYYMREDGLLESIGDYNDLQARLQREQAKPGETERESGANVDYRRRKEEQAERRRQKKRRAELNERIGAAEQALAAVDGEMQQEDCDYQRLMALHDDKVRLEAELLAAMEELERLEQGVAMDSEQV